MEVRSLIKPLKTKELNIQVQGNTYPTGGYFFDDTFQLDSNRAQAKEVFLDLYRIIQQQYSAVNCGLTFEAFLEGSTVIAIQLSRKQYFTA